MDEFQENAVKTYRDLSFIPTLESVRVLETDRSDIYNVETNWSHKDINRNKKIVTSSTGVLSVSDNDSLSYNKGFASHEIIGEQMTKYSRCREKKAVLREVEVKDKKHQFLEIWKGVVKVLSLDLTEEDKHGVVHSNPVFGCMDWSHDNSKLLYVAEKKLPKTKSFFKKSKEDDVSSGNEFLYEDNWGEQLAKCINPSLFIFDIETMEITSLEDSLPSEKSIADAQWVKGDKNIVFVGWHNTPYKLGLIYCKNRASTIYSLNLETKETTALTFTETCVYSVRLNPDSSKLIYFETEALGPHQQCAKMYRIDINEENSSGYSKPQLVVDSVKRANSITSFHGLYIDALPFNNWVSDDQFICNSVHRSNSILCSVNIVSGQVKILTHGKAWRVCFVKNKIIFAAFSTPISPQRLKAGVFKEEEEIKWFDLDVPWDPFKDVSWEINQHIPTEKNKKYSGISFESVLMQPLAGEIKGLIVNPHGGPHSCYVVGFDPFVLGLCKLGFAVVRVNYRGSLGFGQDAVYSLPGNCGTQDVRDVHQAALHAVEKLSISPRSVFVQGGSHGGFLTLHLMGQYPDFYAAGGTRNPVTNMVLMHDTTDITDWLLCEAGLQKYKFGKLLSDADYARMLSVSPIRYASKVKSPLLLMIGAVDLRVPRSQGHAYAKILKCNGVTVKILEYPENNHPIAEIAAEADCFVNMASWFNKYNSGKK